MKVIVVTHLICAAAFGILAVMWFAGRQRGRIGGMLVLASLATVAWALATAAAGPLPFSIVAVIEGVRNAAWLLFMCALLTAGGPVASWARTETIVAVALALTAIAIDLVMLVIAPQAVMLSHLQILARIAVAVLGLSLVENYYRNTEADRALERHPAVDRGRRDVRVRSLLLRRCVPVRPSTAPSPGGAGARRCAERAADGARDGSQRQLAQPTSACRTRRPSMR